VCVIAQAGIMNGKPGSAAASGDETDPADSRVFDPQGRATRAEGAAILRRFEKAVHG